MSKEKKTSEAVLPKPKKNRIEYLDIAKGIGIFLVVWAHAKAPFGNYMYQFHMPFFFLISGLLYNSKATVKTYIWKKVKSLYIPLVSWNLTAFLIKCYINHCKTDFTVKGSLEIILTLSKDGQFFGATWFLGSLFVISILYKIIDKTIPESEFKPLTMVGLFTVFAIIGFDINFRYMISRTLVLGMFFAIGVFVKNYKSRLSSLFTRGMAVVCLITFLVIGSYNSVGMGVNKYRYHFLFVAGALMISFAILYFCRSLEKAKNLPVKIFKKTFMYLGKRSIDIVIWQFVFFRIGIIMQMYLNHEKLTVSGVLSYYPLYSEKNGWWLVYLVIGIVFPLLWGSILRFGPWGWVLKKCHIV